MDDAPRRPDRTLLVILGIIAALVLVSLVVVFSRGAPAQLDASSPEGVVQRYAAAVAAGDEKAAKDFLSADVRDSCTRMDRFTNQNMRITLTSTTVRADSADVAVSIVTSTGGGPFGSDDYRTDGVVDLIREGGDWKIDRTPWELAICTETEVTP